MSVLNLSDFGGGLNLRAAPSELAVNESPACLNVTLDERGGVVKRLGLSRLNTSDGAATGYLNLYFSPVLGYYLIQDGTGLYKTTDFNTLTLLKTFSTSDRVGMCDFATKAIIAHPVDGVFSYDGAAFSTISTSVKGSCCAAWQNRIWVGGDPTNPPLLTFGAQGISDSTTFTAAGAGTNQVREIDSQIITALEVTSYLLVYKDSSTYRVTDPNSGNYASLSAVAGASGNLASVVLGKTFASMNGQGIWVTDGVRIPVNVGEKLKPLFDSAQINFAKLGLIAAGRTQNRLVFSFPYGAAATLNNRTLEYHPREGWIVPHSFGCSAFTNLTTGNFKLYGADPTKKNVYEVFKTGADNGAAIAASFQTPWIAPRPGYKSRHMRLDLRKRGAFSLFVKSDFDTGQGRLFAVPAASSGITWDGGHTWDDGSVWAQINYEDLLPLYPYALAEAVSFVLNESSTISASAPALLGDGASAEVGAFALYGIGIDSVPAGER